MTPAEIRKNSLLDMFVTKLGIRLEQINPDAIDGLQQITIPPGIMDKLPDNIIGPVDIPSDYTPMQ